MPESHPERVSARFERILRLAKRGEVRERLARVRESLRRMSRRRRRVFAAEALLWTLGFTGLAAPAWMWAEALLFQRAARQTLAEVRHPETGAPAPGADSARRRFAPGDPIAEISIEALGLSAVVAEGVSPHVLRRAVGHVPGTPLPGAPGNVALAGHRDTFFRSLAQVRTGDRVVLRDSSASHSYAVEWIKVVEPSKVKVLHDAGYPALTLITCYPFRYVGSAPLRYVVRARKTSSMWTEESS
jgi:sortase A